MTGQTLGLLIALFGLIIVSAIFSMSETALMALNRYRLRHRVTQGDATAKRLQRLLTRPDRVLSIILFGNTLANVLAASIVTLLAIRWWGTGSVFLATLLLTALLLIFAETCPKTWAAHYPEKVAWRVARLMTVLLKIFTPLVWVINKLATGLLRLCRVRIQEKRLDTLSVAELSTLIDDAKTQFKPDYHVLLKRVLDMEQATVEDVMIPRHEMQVIDLNDSWETVCAQLQQMNRSMVAVCQDGVDHLLGVLSVQQFWAQSAPAVSSQASLLPLLHAPYYIPEGTTLSRQFLAFKQTGERIGFVTDEYGDIQGLLGVRDIIDEMIGGFSVGALDEIPVWRQTDGSYIIDGTVALRDINRWLHWSLPADGPRTLSGLLIERLEQFPAGPLCLDVASYRVEIQSLYKNRLHRCRIWPPHTKAS